MKSNVVTGKTPWWKFFLVRLQVTVYPINLGKTPWWKFFFSQVAGYSLSHQFQLKSTPPQSFSIMGSAR